jgi:hypothetical protein
MAMVRATSWSPAAKIARASQSFGHPDIAACHENLGLYLYFNDGKGGFGAGLKIAGPEALPYSMITADLNQDGKPDIVVGFVNAPGAIYFIEGNGRSYHRVSFGDNKGATYGFATGDLNGDGYPDIVAARSGAPSLVFLSKPDAK